MDRDETLEPEVPVAEPPPKRNRPKPEPDRGPFFTEVWQGRPLYRCPFCRIAKTDRGDVSGDAATRAHLLRHHQQAQPSPEDRARASGLVITKR